MAATSVTNHEKYTHSKNMGSAANAPYRALYVGTLTR
jgi:hypothetical protein